MHLVSIDLKKEYGIFPSEILWKTLGKKGVKIYYIRAFQDMHEGGIELYEDIGWRDKRFCHNNRISPRFNLKPLLYHFRFECAYITLPRGITEMYTFYILYFSI